MADPRLQAPAVLVVQAGLRPGLWACRTLAKAGFRVLAGHERGTLLAGRSRASPRVHRFPAPRTDPEGFLQGVAELCRREAVNAVIPMSETALHVLVTGAPDLGGAVFVGPTLEQYRRVCDKAALAELAAEAGFAVPHGVRVDAAGPAGEWPSLPGIVKPCGSATATVGGVVHRTATLVRSPVDRDRAVRRLVGETGSCLVQELVRGPRWRLHFVRHQGGLRGVALRTVRSYPPLTGMSSVSVSVPMPPALLATAGRVLEYIGYLGPGGIQAFERDGDFVVHDVNLRTQYSEGASAAAGVEVTATAVAAALGLPLGPEPEPVPGVLYVWAGGELRALGRRLAGRDGEAPATRIARDLLAAGFRRGAVLDPVSLADPLVFAGGLERVLVAPLRALAARGRPGRRGAG